MLKNLLLTTALAVPLLALAAPAHAVLTVSFQDVNAAITASCSDGSACDNGGAVNQVLQINQTVGNFNIVGTFAASTSGSLQSSNLAIFYTGTGTPDTLRVLVTDNGFAVPVSGIDMAGAITFNQDFGASASTMSFYANTSNVIDTFGSLGVPLFSVSKTPVSNADSQSGTASAAFSAGGPFTMSEYAELNFIPGSDITNFGQTMITTAVPEASTWAMMIIGFLGVGLLGMRRSAGSRSFRFIST